jgi:hypothetical protein
MVKAATVEGKIVLYPQIRRTDLCLVKDWTRAEEMEFLRERKIS